MIIEQIKKFYKFFGYATLGFSLLYILIFRSPDLSERIGAALILNIGYHFFYYVFSKVPLKQLAWLEKNDSPIIHKYAPLMIRVFSIMAIAIIIIAAIGICIKSIYKGENQQLFSLFVLVGCLLGAISLKVNLDKRIKTLYNNK